MCRNWRLSIFSTGLALLLIFTGNETSGQMLDAGFKLGGGLFTAISDDDEFGNIAKIHPVPAFSGGGVLSFKIKDRYFLHTEYLFSTKGKKIKGRTDSSLEDNITHYFIEIPILYNVYFRGKLNLRQQDNRQYKWYIGAGPNFSYWVGGRGTVYNTEFDEYEVPPLDYKIRFGERPENDGSLDVYMRNVRRFQLGANFGGGILLEPMTGQKIMIDLRIEVGHTWSGTPESADYAIPLTYADNLRARHLGCRLSCLYLWEKNLDKKVRNKGKSTLKVKKNRR